jgi:uncharacterized protein YdaU (DUF1376 family)
MTKVERCDYLDLLVFQWTEQAIPADLEAVARILGYRKAAQIPAAVLAKFPLCEDGRRRNARLEVIRSEQRARIARRRDGAAKTNARRWGERSQSESLSNRLATRERVASDVVSESLSDRLATPERVAIDIVGESPPPTTHHPPHIERESQRARPTLAVAISQSGQAGVTEQEAEDWWNAREASDWMKGTGGGGTTRVGTNWQADLKTYTNAMREQRARAAKRAAPSGNGNGATPTAPKTDTVWSLTESIKAINESLTETDASVIGAWGELSPAKKEERRKLVERRKELRRKLSGLEGTG